MNKTDEEISFTFGMLSITTFLMAQGVIGKVVDGDGKPLPYVNIVLFNTQDSTFIKGTTSGKMGISLLILSNQMGF